MDDRRALTDLAFVDVGGGALALTHRPKVKDLARWNERGVTHLVTLLSEREGARDLGEAGKRAGLTWVWIPLAGASVPDEALTTELSTRLDEVTALIRSGGHVVVHCSAGIHRTGMFGYALLRRLGLDAVAARAKLADLRAVTAEGVGEDRLAWGDRV